jgi:hypothetical protein
MPSERPAWPRWIVALAGLWILTGAVFKLVWGTPADLPPPVQGAPLPLGLTYKLVIGVELLAAALALLRPRAAWPLLVALLLAFVTVLVLQVAAGDTSCGCFGSKLKVSPWVPLAVDAGLLLLLLLARPWRARAGGLAPALLVPALVAAVALPWVLDREAAADGGKVGRPWYPLDVETWVGKRLEETQLAPWIDVKQVPSERALWVLYRNACEVCAEHLQYLATAERGLRDVVLLRLPEEGDTEDNKLVLVLPEGDFVHRLEMPEGADWLLQAPGELEVEDGRIVRAVQNIR